MHPITNSTLTNVSSYLDWIKIQADRLAKDEMSLNDKENIISILLSISIEKVEFVVNETLRFIDFNDCNLEILNTLANLANNSHSDIKFLVDQTLRLLNITNHNGSDLLRGKILSILSQMFPHQIADLINQAHCLISIGMSDSDAVAILDALIKAPPQERELLIYETNCLISNHMTHKEKVDLISILFTSSQDERTLLLHQAFYLITSDMPEHAKALLMCALFNVPREKRELFIDQASSLISHAITFDNKIDFISWFSKISQEERRIFIDQVMPTDMIDEDKTSVIAHLSRIPSDERTLFIGQVIGLITRDMTGDDKEYMIDNLSRIPCEERALFINQVRSLITNDMSAENRTSVISSLSSISWDQRKLFISQARGLMNVDMLGEDRAPLIDSLACVPFAERKLFIEQVKDLITDDMLGEYRECIITSLSKIPCEGRILFIDQVKGLITSGMSDEYRTSIIANLSKISCEQRTFFINQVRSLITNYISVQDRVYLIQLLSNINIQNIAFITRQVLNSINRIMSDQQRAILIVEGVEKLCTKTFIVNSLEVIQKPVKVMLNLWEMIEGLSIKLLPSSIQYTDSRGIDEGGLIRSFVSTLTKSFCDTKYSLISNRGDSVIPIDTTDSFNLSLEDEEKCFKIIGRFFSAALQRYNSLVIAPNFDPIVFEMLFKLTKEDLMNHTSEQVFNKLLKIYLIKKFQATEELANDLVQNNITDELKDVYCIDSKDNFVMEHKIDKKIKSILIIAKSMYDSLLYYNWERLKGNSADNLREKIEGVISRDSIKNALQMDPRDRANSISFEYLTKWINAADSETLGKFVEAISGTKTLTSTAKLNIAGMNGWDKLPVFHTCFFRIDISDYSSYEAFKEKLQLSLDYCFSESGFQIT